jgi:hypothetical protein
MSSGKFSSLPFARSSAIGHAGAIHSGELDYGKTITKETSLPVIPLVSLPRDITDILKRWLLEHVAYRYPTKEEKTDIVATYGTASGSGQYSNHTALLDIMRAH